MKKINVLSKEIANKIAAGEVIERPASIVKELVENSIDAGSTIITVEISGGGSTYLRVSDNGSGIYKEDVIPAFYRHATSKIQLADDLFSINTLGFRGEALASVASVAKVELITKQIDEDSGTLLQIEGGEVLSQRDIGCPDGTTITVRELFYNVPARLKFLKKDTTESGHIADIVEKLALSNEGISFKLINNGRETLFTSGDNNLQNCIYNIFGRDIALKCLKVNYEMHGMKLTGLVGNSEIAKNNRNFQIFYINGRYIKNKTIGFALTAAYKNIMMVGKHPFAVLNVEIDPSIADINVHPAKIEVKFVNDKDVFGLVYWGVRNALYEKRNIPVIETKEPKKTPYRQSFFDFSEETLGKTNPKPAEQVELQQYQPKYGSGTIKANEKSYEYEDFVKAVNVPKTNTTISVSIENIDKKSVNTPTSVYSSNNINASDKVKTQGDEQVNRTEPLEKVYENSVPIENMERLENNDFRIIGQIFESYILLEMNNNLVLLDQHAAHERLKYEALKKAGEESKPLTQVLLSPTIIKLSKVEFAIVSENEKFLKYLGYSLENFGNSDIIIRQAPMFTEKDDVEEVFIEILQNICKHSSNIDIERLDKAFNIMACRSAVKANHRLNDIEMKQLVDDVLKLPNINTCPHGRPIMFSMTQAFIEKQFKRT